MSKPILEKNNSPKEWITCNIEDCVEILDGRRKPVNSSEREIRRGKIPYYGAAGQVGFIDDYLFDEELVLLGEDGAPFFDSFKNKAYIINGKSWVNNHAHVLKGKSEIISNKFLCHYLNQIDYHLYVNGTTRLKLNQSKMRQIPVLIPSLNEQKRIVAKIAELFSLIDASKIILENTKILLKQYKQSLLEFAFEGKLVKKNPNDSPVEIIPVIQKKNTGRKASIDITPGKSALSVGKPDIIPPKGWKWVSLLQVAELASGHTPKRSHPEYWDGDIPWVTGGDAGRNDGNYIFETKEKITQLGLENSAAVILPTNTVCLAREASIGFCTILGKPMATNQRFVNFICGPSLIPKYLLYLFLHERSNMFRFKEGTIFGTIYFPAVKAFHICLPPLNEQIRIVAKIEEDFSMIQNNENLVDSLLLQNNLIKHSILKQVFEGKLVPQDPNDEPAEILLQRIKQEKERSQENRKVIKAKSVKPRRIKNAK